MKTFGYQDQSQPGDVDALFTLQSCSKPFTYAICLKELGPEVQNDEEPCRYPHHPHCHHYHHQFNPHGPPLSPGCPQVHRARAQWTQLQRDLP